MDAICATVNVSSVPSSMKGSSFAAFRLAARAGFSASSDPKTYSGRTHLNLLLSMTDLRVREIKRSTAAAREISQHRQTPLPIPRDPSCSTRWIPHRQQPLPIANIQPLCSYFVFAVCSKGGILGRTSLGAMKEVQQVPRANRGQVPIFNVGGAVAESDQPLWKELYTQVLLESDKKKVTLLLFAAELAMTERSRQLLNAPDHHEELTELAVAKAALETIRLRKLGWPPVAPS
jgi:hypothetical protein